MLINGCSRWFISTCLCTLSLVAAYGSADSILAVDQQQGTFECEPTEPFFCANVHIGCSGQSRIRTYDFTLTANADHGVVEASQAPAQGRNPVTGHIARDNEGTYLIFRPRNSRDYIKIMADGTFSFRHYASRGTLMTYGRCLAAKTGL